MSKSLVNEVTTETQLKDFSKILDTKSGYDELSSIIGNPSVFSDLEKRLTTLVKESKLDLASVDKLVGVELGGVPFVSQLSINLNKPYIIVKYKTKGYGTDKLIEGVFDKGNSVIVVMHSITDSALQHCLSILEQNELKCRLVVGILQHTSNSYTVDIDSLYQFND